MSDGLLRRALIRYARMRGLFPEYAWLSEGRVGVHLTGHREYVGGLWHEIGRLQFDFLISEGLTPSDVLLDVGCGALRGGVHFVPYLSNGHYFGIDKEHALLAAGRTELGGRLLREKQPTLMASGDFEFELLCCRPNFAIAQSLFSHLDRGDITRCLLRLLPVMAEGGRFYATFNNESRIIEAPRSHSHAFFAYPAGILRELGYSAGWSACTYVGDFGHPRGQVMMRFYA